MQKIKEFASQRKAVLSVILFELLFLAVYGGGGYMPPDTRRRKS